MTRASLLAVAVFALALAAWPAAASAAAKTYLLANGTVKSLTATALAVSVSGKEMTFSVDAKTQVIGKGIGTKADAKGKDGKAAITDLLAAGDRVNVVYQGTGAAAHATRVELTAKGGTK